MKFVVVPLASKDTSQDPARLTLPAFKPLGSATNTRQASLIEKASKFNGFDGPVEVVIGTLDSNGNPVLKDWDEPITENPALNSTEIWEIYKFTMDAHPIHIHEVQFQVVNRQPFGGIARPPESWERGFKNVVIAYPGKITRIKALFDLPGLY